LRLEILILGLALTVSAGPAHAQTSSGSNRIVSPSVVAYYLVTQRAHGGVLRLLVLWRGTPGWFMRAKGGSGAGGSGGGGFGRWDSSEWMSYGDVTLTIDLTSDSKDYDSAATKATILGREFLLRDVNVVLIDGADSGNPQVLRALRVEPEFTGHDAVTAAVKRSPELFAFLQCDLTLPDPRMQPMMSFLCGQIRP
jgi:hypothetical protein